MRPDVGTPKRENRSITCFLRLRPNNEHLVILGWKVYGVINSVDRESFKRIDYVCWLPDQNLNAAHLMKIEK